MAGVTLPLQWWAVYDDDDFVIEVNTPFAALKREALQAIERLWRKSHKCQAWRDQHCGMLIRIRGRSCNGCKVGTV